VKEVEVFVVGAGSGGLAASYHLKQRGIEHVVLERGRIGESWASQRWDSFALNTPNWSNVLPGDRYEGDEPDGFWHRDEFVDYLRSYVDRHALPVVENAVTTSLDRGSDGRFLVSSGGGDYSSGAVVIASGIMSEPRSSAMASALSESVTQLNAATYRSPSDVPDGAALVVGSAQSGVQIVEDLLAAGREVYLSTSKVGRAPRNYRGRDIIEWWRDMKFLDLTPAQLEDPAAVNVTQPQVSGTRGGHTVSLQQLHRDGCKLLGRISDIQGTRLELTANLTENIAFGDSLAARLKEGVDKYIASNGVDAPVVELDPVEAPIDDLGGPSAITSLELAEVGVNTVIWTTGFTGDFSWVNVPVLDDRGMPIHDEGAAPVDGIYFVGFPWLRKRKSGIIYGVGEDAGVIVERIASH